jgi:hypothetical protein
MEVYSGLITKGFGLPGCCSMLTMDFSLFACSIEVLPPEPTAPQRTGGGPYPGGLAPGEVQRFYQPVGQQREPLQYLTPTKQTTGVISIKVMLKGKTIEKLYEVPINLASKTVKVLNITNKLKYNASVFVRNLKKKAYSVFVKFTKQ